MIKRIFAAGLLSGLALAQAQTAPAVTAASPAKKELVQKVLVLQQSGIENLARNMVEQPAAQMMQAAARALQTQVPADKRENAGKTIESDVKRYVEEAVPPMRERAVKLAPSTIGAVLEEKFTEDELRQLVTWFESPINKKYLQLGPEMQNGFMQKLVAEARPVLDPKLQALEQKVRVALGSPANAASGASAPASAAVTRPPAKSK